MAKSSKAVLWENVETLMKKQFGQRNVTGFASFVGVGIGTVQRIEEQATSVGLEIIDKIAGKFKLASWQLLVPGLNPALPPKLTDPAAERKAVADQVRKVLDTFMHEEPDTEPAALDEPIVAGAAPPPNPKREQMLRQKKKTA